MIQLSAVVEPADVVLLHHQWVCPLHVCNRLVRLCFKVRHQKTTEDSSSCWEDYWCSPAQPPKTLCNQSEKNGSENHFGPLTFKQYIFLIKLSYWNKSKSPIHSAGRYSGFSSQRTCILINRYHECTVCCYAHLWQMLLSNIKMYICKRNGNSNAEKVAIFPLASEWHCHQTQQVLSDHVTFINYVNQIWWRLDKTWEFSTQNSSQTLSWCWHLRIWIKCNYTGISRLLIYSLKFTVMLTKIDC